MSDHTPDRSVSDPEPARQPHAVTEYEPEATCPVGVDLVFEPRAVTMLLAGAAAVLVAMHLLAQFARFYLGLDMSNRLVVDVLEELHLSLEDNLPTYFSALMLLACAVLLLLISLAARRSGRPHSLAWAGLAAVFSYLSADEMLAWHEFLVGPFRALLHTSGLLYFAWVVPYGVLVIALALAYLRFFLWLPPRTRRLFALSALVFLSGAVGFEMLGGRYAELHGLDTAGMTNDLGLTVYQTIEETLEMAGVVLFIYALLSYIRATFPLRVTIGRAAAGGEHDAAQH
ncbi:MAG TPA: hypothetical protein VF171_04025 [Trueperaceae bacterium]